MPMVAKAKHSAALVKRAQARDQRRTERTVADLDERECLHVIPATPIPPCTYCTDPRKPRVGRPPSGSRRLDAALTVQIAVSWQPAASFSPLAPFFWRQARPPPPGNPCSACAVHGGLRPRKPNPDHPDSLISYLGLPLFSLHLLPIPDSTSLHPHSLFLFLGISLSLSSTPLTAPLVGAPVLPFAESTTAS